MAVPPDSEIKAKIKAVIGPLAPLAVVFDYWVLGYDPTLWPGALLSTADSNRTHGYTMRRTISVGTRVSTGCVRYRDTYEIIALHYYNGDTGGTAANSSEKKFINELDAIKDAFANRKTLDPIFADVDPMEWRTTMPPFGGQLLHQGRGVLIVTADSYV
jgi:hypothetical protein